MLRSLLAGNQASAMRQNPRRRSFRRAIFRLAIAGWVVVALAAVVGGVWFWERLCASLPVLDGERQLPCLSASVRVERDAVGVPTVWAHNRLDAFRVLGFLHAQERFFQMDVLRRAAAGELAALLGPALVEADRKVRLHRLGRTAEQAVARASAEERAILAAYVEGVNAGLAASKALPWEYVVLGQSPRRWHEEDTVLVVLAMFLTLQESDGASEVRQGLLEDMLPAELAAFLRPGGTEWDAAVDGSSVAVSPLPGPNIVDVRSQPRAAQLAGVCLHGEDVEANALGSNSWAVAAARSRHGGAILANDMHLGLQVPPVWYRAVLVWPDASVPGGWRRLAGVTLPGTPALVAGSNGHVAWGFTNAYVDTSDVVVVEAAAGNPDAYQTPDGPRRLETKTENIEVRTGAAVAMHSQWTVWGPIVGRDHRGRRVALRWVAHEPEAVNLGLLALAEARNVDMALQLANEAGIQAQNFVCADSQGRVGWTIAGRIPKRVGFDGRRPESWADGKRRWEGWLDPSAVPRLVDPAEGFIWTANNRVVGGAALAVLGDGGYDLGARAGQIRDRLRTLQKANELELLAVQLDDEARFLARWHRLALATLTPAACAQKPRRGELRRVLETTWTGRASVDSAAYRLVRELRVEVAERALVPLIAPFVPSTATIPVLRLPQVEGPLWRLVSERPRHLLAAEYVDWDALVLASLDAVAARAEKVSGSLAAHTWGRRNTVRIRHPLSRALGPLAVLLDLPAIKLPGDIHMPRVQGVAFGASVRLVVSPGREELGILQLPGGQSAHPLSPFYRAEFVRWAAGEPAPFLPGPAQHRLNLRP